MGRVTTKTPAATPPSSAVNHFTHPHPLRPLSLYNPQTLCSGCNLQSTGIMYTCNPCNFTLHQSCAKLPQLITHPSHGGCTLSLLTLSSYPGGRFSCNACNLAGESWNYHCDRCEYDLHVTCASKPMKIRIQSHPSCELHLVFKNPYQNSEGFSCDVCRIIGKNQWLYRCSSCEFDVHLDCINVSVHRHNQQLIHSASTGGMINRSQFSAQPHLMHSMSTGVIGAGYSGQLYPAPIIPVQNNRVGGGLGGNLMVAGLQGLVEGAFQGVGQSVVQDFIGGGGGGGDGSSY